MIIKNIKYSVSVNQRINETELHLLGQRVITDELIAKSLLDLYTGVCSNYTDVPLRSRRRRSDGSETEQRVIVVHRTNLPEASRRFSSYHND